MLNKILSKKNYGAVYGGYYYVDANGKKIGMNRVFYKKGQLVPFTFIKIKKYKIIKLIK